MAEWLRRVIRNHLGFSRAGSNPAGVDILLYFCMRIKRYIVMRHPGIEPGPHRWQRRILTTELMALNYVFKYI